MTWLIMLPLAVLSLSGCDTGRVRGGGSGEDGGKVIDGDCVSGTHRCDGNTFQVCDPRSWKDVMACPARCSDSLGCVACLPGVDYCDGDAVRSCMKDGTPGAVKATCAEGACVNGSCTDPCGRAAAELSYLGCDYWPTVTVNKALTAPADFAVAVANPNSDPVDVSVMRGGAMQAQVQVQPGALQIVKLPWVNELKGAQTSALVPSGAYRLSSSLPVTVYQFNPLEFTAGGQNTYTNDASLLLPQGTLTQRYMVISRPTFMALDITTGFGGGTDVIGGSPGFFTVVATESGATQVMVTFSAPSMAGSSGGIAAYARGQMATFTLNQGDALQIFSQVPSTCSPTRTEVYDKFLGQTSSYGYCDMPLTDLTGTEIVGDKKLAVFSGHDCAFVPYDKWACDHLEEQMLPLEGWGKQYVAVKVNRTPASIPDLFRVVSAENDNVITFEPPVSPPMMLNRGQWKEFPATQDFKASGKGPFALAQFMVGQDYNGLQSGGSNPGDPAMSLTVPIEQYRDSYIFLAPDTYTLNYVNVTAPTGSVIMLDGQAVPASQFKAVGGTGYGAARIPIDPGPHTITGSNPFGIAVYGLAPYTSYMYPGGLDVKQINIQ